MDILLLRTPIKTVKENKCPMTGLTVLRVKKRRVVTVTERFFVSYYTISVYFLKRFNPLVWFFFVYFVRIDSVTKEFSPSQTISFRNRTCDDTYVKYLFMIVSHPRVIHNQFTYNFPTLSLLNSTRVSTLCSGCVSTQIFTSKSQWGHINFWLSFRSRSCPNSPVGRPVKGSHD